MSKQLNIKCAGQSYTLEYTRKTVKTMERNGFVIGEIFERPMTLLPTLFAGAFLANHPKVTQNEIKQIFEKMPRKSELVPLLAEMYNEPLVSLLDDPEEDEGNADWAASW